MTTCQLMMTRRRRHVVHPHPGGRTTRTSRRSGTVWRQSSAAGQTVTGTSGTSAMWTMLAISGTLAMWATSGSVARHQSLTRQHMMTRQEHRLPAPSPGGRTTRRSKPWSRAAMPISSADPSVLPSTTPTQSCAMSSAAPVSVNSAMRKTISHAPSHATTTRSAQRADSGCRGGGSAQFSASAASSCTGVTIARSIKNRPPRYPSTRRCHSDQPAAAALPARNR